MRRTSVILVDDEIAARNLMRGLLGEHPEFEVTGEADSVDSAIQTLDTLKPDVVFLDIRLRSREGFEVLDHLSAPLPRVVMVTAYAEYAVRAFEENAVDYLLKPVTRERLGRTLQRLQSAPLAHDLSRLREIMHALGQSAAVLPDAPEPARIVAREGTQHILIDTNLVRAVYAERNHVWVDEDGRMLKCQYTISQIENILRPPEFVRVSRSIIVNCAAVRGFERDGGGRLTLLLRPQGRVATGPGYRERISRYLGL